MYDLWMFKLIGGEPFSVQPRGNPSVVHDGGTSIFWLMLTEDQANLLADRFRKSGCQVETRKSDKQLPEQHEERRKLLGHGRENRVWPSVACPGCFWFDPVRDDDPCGYQGWGAETVSAALDQHEKARADLRACPLGRGGVE